MRRSTRASNGWPSSGKSSAVRAGLLPALASFAVAGIGGLGQRMQQQPGRAQRQARARAHDMDAQVVRPLRRELHMPADQGLAALAQLRHGRASDREGRSLDER